MVIRRIGPASCAKVGGVLYAGIGLLIGACFSLVFFAIGGMGLNEEMGGSFMSTLFGAAAIVVLPIVYGIIGVVSGLFTALFYNLAAGFVGGIDIDVDSK